MKQQISHWTIVLDIIEAGLARDPEKLQSYAALLVDRLEESGDKVLATRIRRRLERGIRSAPAGASGSVAPAYAAFAPVDPESRNAFADEVLPSDEEPLVLPPLASLEVKRFVALQKHEDAFLRHDIPTPRTLLLYGPPGCGKTSTARYIARALRLPLLVVRLDAVMSSFLGTTAKNLRSVFEYAARRHAILFLDEFDAVAKMRDDSNEVGEIKRIVNSLIQNLDTFPGLFVIAATNHEHLLDPAVWRRFDAAIEMPMPGLDERFALLRNFLRNPEIAEADLRWIALLMDGSSGADLAHVSVRALQEHVLQPDEQLLHLLTREVWYRYGRAANKGSQSQSDDRTELVRFIERKAGGRISARAIEALTGIPDSTISRIRRSEEEWASHAR